MYRCGRKYKDRLYIGVNTERFLYFAQSGTFCFPFLSGLCVLYLCLCIWLPSDQVYLCNTQCVYCITHSWGGDPSRCFARPIYRRIMNNASVSCPIGYDWVQRFFCRRFVGGQIVERRPRFWGRKGRTGGGCPVISRRKTWGETVDDILFMTR